MNKSVVLTDFSVPVFLKKSKGNSVRIKINSRAEVFLYKPFLVPKFFAIQFLRSRWGWVEEKMLELNNRKKAMEKLGPAFQKYSKSETRKMFLENRQRAMDLVLDRLTFWKNFYKDNFKIDFVWNRVGIKNTATRWGSCSSKKNLNFSYKIIFLSEKEADYLVIHELSHLLEMNHGKNFWDLVSLGCSDYKHIRRKMRGVE